MRTNLDTRHPGARVRLRHTCLARSLYAALAVGMGSLCISGVAQAAAPDCSDPGNGISVSNQTVHVTTDVGGPVCGGTGGSGNAGADGATGGGAGSSGQSGGSANGNTVTVTAGSSSQGRIDSVYGGYGGDGGIGGDGGYSSGMGGVGGSGGAGGATTGNTVTISGGNVGYAYGGYGGEGGRAGDGGYGYGMGGAGGAGGAGGVATGNTVSISSGTVSDTALGGYGGYGGHGGTAGDSYYSGGGTGGAGGPGGVATGNTVTISGGAVGYAVFGGYGGHGGYGGQGGYAGHGNSGNGGTGGAGGAATNNSVTISAGTVGFATYGGHGGEGGQGGEGNDGSAGGTGGNGGAATGNTLVITGGTTGVAIGGAGGNGGDGGYGGQGGVDGTGGNGGAATGNTVTITGGTIGRDVYGGHGGYAGYGSVHGHGGNATNNRVIIKGAPTFGANSILYGGTGGGQGADVTSGNVLALWTKGITVRDVHNFAEYDFLLPADTQSGDTILTLTNLSGSDISGAKVGVAMQSGGNVLKQGDQVTLIHNDNGLGTTGVTQVPASAMKDKDGNLYQGVSLGYTFTLSADPDDLYANVSSVAQVLDQTKAPVEGVAAGMTLLRGAGTLLSSSGIGNATQAAGNGSGPTGFVAVQGGSSNYHTGSHVRVDGWAMLVGVAQRFANQTGDLTAGAFVEGGRGDYTTYNDFTGGQSVKGDGKAHYVGAGMFARQDWHNGVYLEGALRGGRTHDNWGSDQMQGADHVSYDFSMPYYGASAGVGYMQALSPKLTLDGSAKFAWTHQDGANATLAGDPYHFEAINSTLSTLGLRADYAFTSTWTGHAGLAWQHEFDGVAHATAYGLATPAPSLKGDTGVFDLGVDIHPQAAAGALVLGISAQGYTGARRGVAGVFRVGLKF